MMNTVPIIIIGSGGHAKVLIDILCIANLSIIGMTDKNTMEHGRERLGIPIIGNDDTILSYSQQEILLVNGLGSVGSTIYRQRIFETFKKSGYSFCSAIHASVILARDSTYGEGVQIMAGAVIQPSCILGDNVIINTKASLDHDCIIQDHVHIAPGATISGGVTIAKGAHIGTGAVVIQGINIGENSIIGAGAVVIRDVPDNTVVAGVPAKAVRKVNQLKIESK